MSTKQNQEYLINEFLDAVAKKLPMWLKGNPEQRNDVLQELGDHIWDKAEELAQGEEPSTLHVREAIALMGSPKEIAKEYRNRGTPKFFITEELWSWYTKGLWIVFAITVFANLLSMSFAFGRELTIREVVLQAFGGIWDGLLIGFVVVSLIFIQLSYHGFLPEDFKKMTAVKEIKAEIDISTRMKKPKTKVDKKEPKILEKPGTYLAGGIFSLIFGFLLIFFPWENINQYSEPDLTALFTWLTLLGGVMVISGLISFSQAIAGKQIRLQQILLVFNLIPSSLTIPLMLQFLNNTAIIIDPLLQVFPYANILLYVKIGVWFIVAATILGMIQNISKIIKLEFQGLPEQKKEVKIYYKL